MSTSPDWADLAAKEIDELCTFITGTLLGGHHLENVPRIEQAQAAEIMRRFAEADKPMEIPKERQARLDDAKTVLLNERAKEVAQSIFERFPKASIFWDSQADPADVHFEIDDNVYVHVVGYSDNTTVNKETIKAPLPNGVEDTPEAHEKMQQLAQGVIPMDGSSMSDGMELRAAHDQFRSLVFAQWGPMEPGYTIAMVHVNAVKRIGEKLRATNELISADELKDLRHSLWASRKDSEMFRAKLVDAQERCAKLEQVLQFANARVNLLEERSGDPKPQCPPERGVPHADFDPILDKATPSEIIDSLTASLRVALDDAKDASENATHYREAVFKHIKALESWKKIAHDFEAAFDKVDADRDVVETQLAVARKQCADLEEGYNKAIVLLERCEDRFNYSESINLKSALAGDIVDFCVKRRKANFTK